MHTHFHFNYVKQIETNTLDECQAGYIELSNKGNSLTIYFDDPGQIQILVNALVDLFLKMSAKNQAEQSDPDSTDEIKPILIEQIREEK